MVRRVRYLVNQKLFAQVVSQLQPDYIQRLEELLDSHQVERRSPYNNLKQLPKRATRNHLNDLVAHLSWLETLGDVKLILANITAAKIHYFAAEVKALDASVMKDFTLPKRITLLLCLIYLAGVQTRDNLALMFLKQVRKIHHKGKEELQRLQQQHQDTTEKLIGVLANILQVFVDEPIDTEVVHRVNQVLTPSGGVQQLLNECETINAYKGNNYLPLIWRFYKSHRAFIL